MSTGQSNQETEIKLRLGGAAEGRRLLKRAGFRVVRRRVFEDNTLFDTEDRKLQRAGLALRVRQCGRRVLLTFKGRVQEGKHKSREELELEISEAATFTRILSRLGLEPGFRYQKYRTEYARRGDDGLATLDETPIGCFLELEGEPKWIDRTAAELGFGPTDYITASYASLYWQHREQNPQTPQDMVFSITSRTSKPRS
jgi:adenylate cyclase class 2